MAVIVGNGPLRASRALRQMLADADLLLCADGGLNAAYALRLVPHVVIGDFDSAPPAALRWAKRRGVTLLQHPAEKDKTDTELALDLAVERGATQVDFVGVLGGRIDHALANVGLLEAAVTRRLQARILHGRSEMLLAGQHTPLSASPGDLVTLLATSDTVEGVSTRGLKYPLDHATLRLGSTRGVSNVVMTTPAAISMQRGRLLIVVTHREITRRRS